MVVALCGCGGPKSDASAAPNAPSATASGTPASATAAAADNDLFAFAAGARFVAKPEAASYSDMAYGPYNLIDESTASDWTGEAAKPAVFVLELPEQTALTRLAFDTGGMNREEKAPNAVTVEVSDVSATEGFKPALTTSLKVAANGQSFTLPAKVTGRWVRLTVSGSHGDEYVGFTGFHGYGEQLTHTATIANVSGTYEGWSGWGKVHLKQEGSRVTGCYEYRDGVVAGGVEGGLLKVEMIEQVDGGGTDRQLGLFIVSSDGKALFGLTRQDGGVQDYGYNAEYSGDKISNDIGDCPKIPGWKGQAARSQLSKELETSGRARLDGVNFDFNSANLQPSSKALLDQVAGMLKEHGDWQITLEGHTDNIGGPAFNKTLSEQRAASVKAYLVGAGVPAERLTSVGFGFDKPVAPNDTQGGRAQNRRVEIVKR